MTVRPIDRTYRHIEVPNKVLFCISQSVNQFGQLFLALPSKYMKQLTLHRAAADSKLRFNSSIFNELQAMDVLRLSYPFNIGARRWSRCGR